MEIDSDYIHSGIRKLIRILDTENQYGSRVRVTDVYMEVQSVGVHSSQYNHLLLHIYKHLLYFLCVQILICTNRTECHRTRITGEENTCKQRAR